MPHPLITLTVLVYATILLFGGSVTYFAYRAYRRTGTRAMGSLCLGLALVTVALIVHGSLYGVLYDGAAVLGFIPGILGATGFGLLLYSLYTRREQRGVGDTL